MCGIAGTFKRTGMPPVPSDGVRRALRCIAHRGPDDEGLYEQGRAVLGHRRLSIIDTSSAGHQPFVDAGGRFAIAFNGEVFNFQQMRAELEAAGHTFRSRTDTEVVLRLFAVKGPAFLHDLNGFFAFAIHDRETDELFLARDRFGVKPLWWSERDGGFFFCSELRGLVEMGAVTPWTDPASLAQYLRYYYVPAPNSVLRDAHKLLPGHSIRVGGSGVNVERWYDLPAAVKTLPAAADPIARLRGLMDDAVRLRLISDVPVGTFLSGGLDSSIVSAITARHHRSLHTFSIGYADDPFFDETRYAEEVAARIGSTHTTFKLTRDELAQHYVMLLDAIDEPFADSSALPSFILCARTRRHVTVALSGDGGDEVFGGYSKHQAELRWRHPGLLERTALLLAPVWRALPRSRNNALANRIRQLDRFARLSGLDERRRFIALARFEAPELAHRLLRGSIDEGILTARDLAMTEAVTRMPGLNGMLFADVQCTLPNDMLHKVDLTSMAHALEVRTPFLDTRVVEFAFSLPAEAKFRVGSGKHLLRQAFGDLLPASVLARSKKGFEVPLLDLFRTHLRPFLDALFTNELVAAAGLRPDAVRSIRERLMSNDPGNAQATVHALAVYLSWWRRWIGARPE